MTKKELSRRALYERDQIVLFLMDNHIEFDSTSILNLLQKAIKKGLCQEIMETQEGDCVIIHTKNTILKCVKEERKGYPHIDDNDIFVKGLGTFTFNKLVKLRGEPHYYKIKLVNYDEEMEAMYFEVETTKTLKQFEKEYRKLRNRWFREKPYGVCLMDYLHDHLYESGFAFYEITPQYDLELTF